MTFRFLCVLVASAWMACVAGMAARGGQEKTTNDGVFTAEQAARGEAAYRAECASCHNGDLGGDGFAPALAGTDFATNWNDLTVGDFFERIRISMPPNEIDKLTPQQKADVVAYILSYNGYAAGPAELEAKTEPLKAIKIAMKQ